VKRCAGFFEVGGFKVLRCSGKEAGVLALVFQGGEEESELRCARGYEIR
jgi:hypothetical protein